MFELHYWPTPNGKKVSILLEELGVDYRMVPIAIGRGEQFSPEFLRKSPNARMPALVDLDPRDGGEPFALFESGAILMYLAEKTGRFGGQTERERHTVSTWVFWQMANQGPKFGEAGHFRRLGPEYGDQTYALTRFTDETHRIYGVMNQQLYQQRYLTGAHYTIADIASYPWAKVAWDTVDPDEFRYVARWLEDVGQRPGVTRGMNVGQELNIDYSALTADEMAEIRRVLYNQRARPVPDDGLLTIPDDA